MRLPSVAVLMLAASCAPADGQIPTYVNTAAVGRDGAVYAIARVPGGGRVRGDLIRIPPVQGGQ